MTLEGIALPTDTILTCEYHLRDSENLRERWKVRLLANVVERERYSTHLDGLFKDGDVLFGQMRCITLPGGFYQETALLLEGSERVLIIGDVICGSRLDAGIPPDGLGIAFPEYVPDLRSFRESLHILTDASFDVICFGHGEPVRERAEEKLRRYAESDDVWESLQELKDRRGEKVAD